MFLALTLTGTLLVSGGRPQEPPGDPAAADAVASAPPRREYLLRYSDRRSAGKYVEWLAKDGINLFSRPWYWDATDWRELALGTGATVAAFAVDETVGEFVHDHPSRHRTEFLNDVERVYSGPVLDYGPWALFAAGLIGRNDRLADAGFLSLESVFYADRVSAMFKSVTHRERPWTADGPFEFHGPGGSTIDETSAFVSGHTIAAFAFAASVSEVWKEKKWVAASLYGLSTLIALQRLDTDAHWTSDVVGAALAGRAIGKRIVRFHYPVDRGDSSRPSARCSWTPLVGGRVLGVALTLSLQRDGPETRSGR